MTGALQRIQSRPRHQPVVRHAVAGHPRRAAAEDFIRDVFRRRYEAEVPGFAPNLMLLEQAPRIVAAAGWRGAESEALMLEQYLDEPIEHAISRLAGQPVPRGRIVEVGNLAAERPGGSVAVILALAAHLDQLGFEWVVFTATSELIGIFRRLDLPPLALAPADPHRLGAQAQAWGRYYDTRPVVVAGRLRLALEKGGARG
ncbi:thermostable hemolysin [Thauera sp. CAU 1555]|uniref:Thermostable hemolysin n=1 Tax=Thauera sedimentorum TaxID=2767595 RepID=A0ABR9BAD5_9RHOO|nr:thermostable hemolysin [Thauera sedimentorum]MBC9072378.1 thermostable hemolysin [Thauera sedimentorum]MBD8503297.1 thermostable hemolysin [Thauera sedimentorum]